MDLVVCENVASLVVTNVSGPLADMEEIELHPVFINILSHVFDSFTQSMFINIICQGKTGKLCFFLES